TMALAAAASRAAPRRLRLAAALVLAGLILAPAAAWALRDSLGRSETFGRLLRWRESDSRVMRLLTWRSAVQGFGERPLLGWGHGNVYYALNRYYDPTHVRFNLAFTESRPTWYDKSHSAFIDLAVEGGIAGILLFAFVVVTMARGLQALRDRPLALVLSAALAAYLAGHPPP